MNIRSVLALGTVSLLAANGADQQPQKQRLILCLPASGTNALKKLITGTRLIKISPDWLSSTGLELLKFRTMIAMN